MWNLNSSFETSFVKSLSQVFSFLRENITELEVGNQEHTNQTLSITSLEKRLEEQHKMQANMEKRMLVLNSELDHLVLWKLRG
jgi:CII-binding regulator of phage lambda lysogenization HflD